MTWFATGFSLPESEERQHRQHLPGGHCGLVTWHQERCASRAGGECDCRVHVELDLPGKN